MSRSTSPERSSLAVRLATWGLWGTPRALRAYVLLIEAVVLPLALVLLARSGWHTAAAERFVVLCALAIGFEELSARVVRLRTRLATYTHVDMTSVWTFAAAMVLPVGGSRRCC